MLLGGRHELGLHELNVAHWDAQHPDPFLVAWEPSSSPHPGIQIHALCGRLQWRDMTTTVPHLCLSQMHLNSGILCQRLLQQFVDGGDPFRKSSKQGTDALRGERHPAQPAMLHVAPTSTASASMRLPARPPHPGVSHDCVHNRPSNDTPKVGH